MQADEELLLLEGIEIYGLGNWPKVAGAPPSACLIIHCAFPANRCGPQLTGVLAASALPACLLLLRLQAAQAATTLGLLHECAQGPAGFGQAVLPSSL